MILARIGVAPEKLAPLASLPHCLNERVNGAIDMAKVISVFGTKYKSISSACRAHSVNSHDSYMVSKYRGVSVAEAIELLVSGNYKGNQGYGKSKPIVISGIKFGSISAAARAVDLTSIQVSKAVSAGAVTFYGIYSHANRSCFYFCGMKYSSVKAAARTLGISYKYVCNLISRGVDVDLAIAKAVDAKKYKCSAFPRRSFLFTSNVTFFSERDACKLTGVDTKDLWRERSSGFGGERGIRRILIRRLMTKIIDCKGVRSPLSLGTNHSHRHKRAGVKYSKGVTAEKLALIAGMRCQVCGVRLVPCRLSRGKYPDNSWTIGHIVALSRGGSGLWENLQAECRRCNMDKGVKSMGQFNFGFGG